MEVKKIKKVIKWKPKISIEKGIEIMKENINDWKKAPVWTPGEIKKKTKADVSKAVMSHQPFSSQVGKWFKGKGPKKRKKDTRKPKRRKNAKGTKKKGKPTKSYKKIGTKRKRR